MAKRQGREYWQGHLAAWTASGLTPPAYCARHGINLQSFYRWRRKQKAAVVVKPLTLVPVNIEALDTRGAVHLHSPGGWRIELPDAGAAWLAGLLRQLP